MSSLINHGGTWYIQWYHTGKKRKRSTRIRVETDPRGTIARQIQRDFDSRQAKRQAGLEDEDITLAEGFHRYLALQTGTPRWIRDQKTRAHRWVEFFHAVGVDAVSGISAENVQEYLTTRARSGKTLRIELNLLRAMVEQANRSRVVTRIRVEDWPEPPRALAVHPDRIGAYSRAEVDALIKDMEHPRRRHWLVPLMVLAYTGCRWGEMDGLKVADINLEGRTIRFQSTKTARSSQDQHRTVEIHPALQETLQELTAGRAPGECLIDCGISNDFDNILKRSCERLGIQYRRVHGLRHSWISRMLQAGVPLAVVMQMAGHRNLATTQRYLHIADAQVGWVTRL